jgi:hypothetical protein
VVLMGYIWVIFSASKVFCCAFPQVFYDNFENWDGRWSVSQSSDYGGNESVCVC